MRCTEGGEGDTRLGRTRAFRFAKAREGPYTIAVGHDLDADFQFLDRLSLGSTTVRVRHLEMHRDWRLRST